MVYDRSQEAEEEQEEEKEAEEEEEQEMFKGKLYKSMNWPTF